MPGRSHMRIEVEPPSTIQVGQVLRPRMVVSLPTTVYCDFMMAYLITPNNVSVAGAMTGGEQAGVPSYMETGGGGSGGSSSRSGGRLYSVWSSLAINQPGTYRIYVEAQMIDPSTGGYVKVADVTTENIQVMNRRVAAEKPSSSEKRLLASLQECGFY